jgi:hypothetical protein
MEEGQQLTEEETVEEMGVEGAGKAVVDCRKGTKLGGD